jgi:glucose/arabinose dehydrogenase
MTRAKHIRNILILLVVALIGGIWYAMTPDKARLELAEVQGALPKLTKVRPETIPSIRIAEIVGWQKGAMPVPAAGLKVQPFAAGLDHPRWLYELPNGDVLVAESTNPTRQAKDLGDRITRWIMRRANGAAVSANRITLLRDADGDGTAELRSAFITGLNSPFGMVLVGERLFVANTDSLMEFPYKAGDTKIAAKGRKVMELPAQLPNNHWARNVIASPDGQMLYVSIGSNSNIGENGMASEKDRAQIKELNLKTGQHVIYGYGLRNPNGMAFHPKSQTLWTTVNERDMLGSDGPPDYLTAVDFGTFYGWPFTYWGKNQDQRVPQARPDLLQYTRQPDYALGPHVAALGLAFTDGAALGPRFANGAFIGLHGSWNRSPPSGYKVIYVPFNDRGFPLKGAKPVDVLTGFLDKDGDAQGRPAGVLLDKNGALLVADDSGNTIWRVSAAGGSVARE